MKTSFKTLVRAISPFVGPKGRNEPDAERSYADYHWDLTKVDMEAMLTSFYRVYNPERVSKVPQILGEFGGEEILMLQQLCERYKLSEADIQRFLDESPLGKKDRFGNWMRRNDSNSNAALPTSSSEDHGKFVDYGTYKWDLEGIDLAKALKLLYRTHNPEKKPNVATLQNKTIADKILLLQQLCKRHNLSQGDMRAFLDKARIKADSAGSGTNNAGHYSTAADDSSVSSRGRSARAAMEAAVGLFSAPAQKPPPPPPAPSASTTRETSRGEGGEASNVITGAGLQRQGALPLWQNSFPSPTAGSSPPPPPPPPPTPPRLPQSAISGFFADAFASKGSPGSEVGSVNSSVTAPTIVSGLGSRSKLGAAVAARAASAGSASVASANRLQRAPSPAPSVLTTSSIGSASVGRGLRAASAGSAPARSGAQPVPASSTAGGADQDAQSRARSRAGSLVSKQRSVRGASIDAVPDAHSAELLQMQTELSEARTQITGLERENRALQKALQESRQRQNDAESTISGLSSQPHPEQVPELLLEVSKLNGQLKQQEERELALKRQFSAVKQQLVEQQEMCARAEQRGEEARADCRDVLRLVDIMSASPAGIRAVLEAYLKKLGDATNNMTVKLGIGTDGRQVPISERIALALQLKREQERPSAEAAGGESSGSTRHEHNSSKRKPGSDGRVVGGGSAGDESDGSLGQSGGGPRQGHRDNYELFRTKIAQARQKGQKGRDKASGRSASDRVASGGAPEDSKVPELQRGDAESAAPVGVEQGEDFADYASPGPTWRARTAERTGGNGSSKGVDPDPAHSAQGDAADWIECFDPRSRRKYYYSAALKKSTWVRPVNFNGPDSRAASPAAGAGATAAEKPALGAPALASMVSGVPTRYASPLAPSRQLLEQQQQQDPLGHRGQSDGRAQAGLRPNRTSSPATAPVASSEALFSSAISGPFPSGSFSSHGSASDYSAIFTSSKKGLVAPGSQALSHPGTAKVSSSSPAPSRSSSPAASLHSRSTLSRSSSPAPGGGSAEDARADWVAAVDPRSQRKYWYNRRTKVSTWRQPAELIV